uniref:Uncharacterized protein n=1 Tax=Oryza brachyantha TaxID=4533 RepID=J3L2J4_ORYBR
MAVQRPKTAFESNATTISKYGNATGTGDRPPATKPGKIPRDHHARGSVSCSLEPSPSRGGKTEETTTRGRGGIALSVDTGMRKAPRRREGDRLYIPGASQIGAAVRAGGRSAKKPERRVNATDGGE